MMRRHFVSLFAVLALNAMPAVPLSAQVLNEALLNGLTYRNLGPFRAGAWTVAVAIPETPAKAHRNTIYAALRTGGVWKSSNGGVTFEPVMDSQSIYSMGAIAVAPSDENVVWAGTGDNSATRSAYWGDGVYKSTDAGKTWQQHGAARTPSTSPASSSIPRDPDTVYVAALGHLATPNTERGVFKTTDGGKTWKKVLYVGDHVGAVDLVSDPRNPDVLYAATYEHRACAWVINDGGPGTGLYKTTDGGATWKELTNGLPKGPMGRIGIDICRSQARHALRGVRQSQSAPRRHQSHQHHQRAGVPHRRRRSAPGARSIRTMWMSAARPATRSTSSRWTRTIPIAFGSPGRTSTTSDDGGKTWAGPRRAAHVRSRAFGDFRSPVDRPAGFRPHDRDLRRRRLPVLRRRPHRAALHDHPGRRSLRPRRRHGDALQHLRRPAGSRELEGAEQRLDGQRRRRRLGDGRYRRRHVQPGRPHDSRWVYNTQEFGGHGRYDQKTHERVRIVPTRAQGQPAAAVQLDRARLVLSPHNPQTLYAGAQVLFRSVDRGDHWQEISPDLTTNDPEKTNRSAAGSAIQYCTIVTISESPVTPGIIWVGTDDGKVQVTRNGGANWSDVTKSIAAVGGPEDVWTSRVYASRFAPGTAYVAKTGRRQDDFKPYLFKTTDFGATWTQHLGEPPAVAGQRHRRGHAERVRAVCRNRYRRLCLDRRRRALGGAEEQHAARAGDRPRGASARAGPRGRHLRPRHLGGRYRAHPRDDGGEPQGPLPVRGAAETHSPRRRPGQLPLSRRQLSPPRRMSPTAWRIYST